GTRHLPAASRYGEWRGVCHAGRRIGQRERGGMAPPCGAPASRAPRRTAARRAWPHRARRRSGASGRTAPSRSQRAARASGNGFARFPLSSTQMNPTEVGILDLIATRRERRPARDLPALAALFRRLAACAAREANDTEDRIWGVWMHHPHRGAAAVLDLATRDIAAKRYDIAEPRLTAPLR